MDKFQDPRTIYRPSDIINDICPEYEVGHELSEGLESQRMHIGRLNGFGQGEYCYKIGKTNTGLAFFIERNDENRFKYFFMTLRQCVRGFRNAMRPLILVDGTTLKTKYKGKLIIATRQDTNIQIYPLAFGIVDGENDRAMHWFFTKLKEIIGDIKNLAFVTDREQSIINGITEVFSEAHHDYCMYHIRGNLKTRMSIQHDESNNAESLNTLFKKNRELPIFAMIENIRDKLQQ
ncbi:uncharacterized protein LOC111388580 [Olea europaea var. sylvestris]|uniref:uncharacterized protein LOC111388580 n=1 Tax=Olea europaea var. sylvestris TaxID=158386 RepID=UPI000C1D8218|nr:uncharacterized protein LOC111388580 [Olea europaea var. sylvestris]